MSDAQKYQYCSQEDARAVRDAGEKVVKLVVSLSALGLNSSALLEYVTAIADGKEPSASLGVGRPKPVTIQLHSFLHDPRQYSGVYNMPEERASALRALAASDPDAAREEVLQFVSDSPRIRASGRAVVISNAGVPGTTNPGASPLAGASQITKSYAREIASNSGVYGSYQFETFDTKREETQKFGVDLGANFFVLAQSKKLAISVARIACVKGRTDPLCVPYVYYVDKHHKCIGNGDIPDSTWGCLRGPRDEPPSKSSRFPRADDAEQMTSLTSRMAAASVVGSSPADSPERGKSPAGPKRGS
jgi:hypothetical protein